MNQNVEALAVQHQPRHDVLELLRLKDDAELRDRVRADRLVAEGSGSDRETADDRVAQAFGCRPGGRVVIDMGVIAFEFGHWSFSCWFAANDIYLTAAHHRSNR